MIQEEGVSERLLAVSRKRQMIGTPSTTRVPLLPSCHDCSHHIQDRVFKVLNYHSVRFGWVQTTLEVHEGLDGCVLGTALINRGGFWLVGRRERDLKATMVGTGVSHDVDRRS